MPKIRYTLWFLLAALLYLNYETWNREFAPPPQASAPAQGTPTGTAAPSLDASVPSAASAPSTTPPAASTATPSAPNAGAGLGTAAAPATASTAAGERPLLHVVTDVYDIRIDLKGGELDRVDLLKYPVRKDAPDLPVRLLNRDSPQSLYVLQSGLTAAAGQTAPTHLVEWSAARDTYTLAAGADELRVPLTWSDGAGVTVTKTFVFKRGSYAIDLDYRIENASPSGRAFAPYAQILSHWEKQSRSYFDVNTFSFRGPSVFDGSKARDLKVENESDAHYAATVTNGWLATLQHHFVSAIVPPAGQPYHFQLAVQGHDYLWSATGPTIDVPAGGNASLSERLFVGPKLQAQLAAAGPRLDLAADYGLLTVIAHPLFATLEWVHGITGNWGWSIIIVTALIKLLFYPLSQASGRSMAKMRAVAPRMKQLQETYKDDREKLGKAMMELYKREKINPLGGCLPTLVQIPILMAFYWVLVETVEMRQAPFMGWINDLSVHDSYFVLPILLGGAMFAQSRLNPAPADPTQAKLMQFMPIVMTAMMAWFPSGLALYWLTNTVLSMVQQWRINQVVQAEAAKQRA